MPLFEMQTQYGRMLVRMKAQALAERDIQNYGPIERTDEEIRTRARYHIEQIERTKPTPETVVTDDVAAFSKAIQEEYQIAYKGLMVGYTGLKEPYRLHGEPRYTTRVNFDDREDEHPFCERRELLALLKQEQDRDLPEGQDPLSIIRVSIFDHQNLGPHQHFITYEVEGDRLMGVIDQSPGWDDVILGLGLPLAEDFEHDKAGDMDTMQTQLKVWTRRPSEILREVIRQHDLVLIEVDELVKHSRFNGLFVIFLRLSKEQNDVLEGVVAHLGLRYERCQLDHLYDTRWYPSRNPRERGTHDAEIDLWHVKGADYPRCYTLFDSQNAWRVQENSPQEAIRNLVFRIRRDLDKRNEIPEQQRSRDVRNTLAHHEGYLERVRQEFPHLWPQVTITEENDV